MNEPVSLEPQEAASAAAGCAATPEDRAFYDEGWSRYWGDLKRYSPVGRHTRRWILRYLRRLGRFDSLADVGCGEGTLLTCIARHYPQVRLYGLDLSSESVAVCQRRVPDARLICADVLQTTRPFDRDVDVAVVSEVLEHLDDDHQAVRNLHTWCRHLIITVPSGPMHADAKAMGHRRHYAKDDLTGLLEQCGYHVLAIRAWGFPMAAPVYAWLRGRAGYGAVTGHYGPARRALTHALYAAFFLNDLFDAGNKLFALARRRDRRTGGMPCAESPG